MAEGKTFRALVLEETDGKVRSSIQDVPETRLPEGDVLVRVAYSDLNYKDGMILNGLGKLVRRYPHIPGVDFAGVVEASDAPGYKPGDEVILTGWRVGEAHWGGYATRARVKSDWLVPLPHGMTMKQAMAIGTAGFTAMLAVMALEDHDLTPDRGEVLITGAAGGVGSVAIAVLAKRGYQVAASTGRADVHDYLYDLGAATIVPRSDLEKRPEGPLARERWAGAIDNVGGTTLANLLSAMRHGGCCGAVGLAGGATFTASLLPFLLRGVKLLGIDSVLCPIERRLVAWQRLARELPMDKLDAMTETVPLTALPDLAGRILKGGVRGRTVVDVAA